MEHYINFEICIFDKRPNFCKIVFVYSHTIFPHSKELNLLNCNSMHIGYKIKAWFYFLTVFSSLQKYDIIVVHTSLLLFCISVKKYCTV